MGEVWKPQNEGDVAAAVNDAIAARKTMELIGAGSRRKLGRAVSAGITLDLSALSGVVSYQPEELVLSVRPATPLAELTALLAERGQRLAFDPPDFGALWGQTAAAGTIGGAIMVGRGGPRRLTAGGPRDHCLGVKGVNGFGKAFAAGGRVVKNVTGFDLPKLVTGSFGTLCAVTELSLKVLPAPQAAVTLVVAGLSDDAAVTLMSKALASPAQVSAAAHLPAGVGSFSEAMTLLLLEGARESLGARQERLATTLAVAVTALDEQGSAALWRDIGGAALFAGGDLPVWALSAPPSLAPALTRRLAKDVGGRWFFDWGGGLIWLETPAANDAHGPAIRRALAEIAPGAHATLIRAGAATSADPFQPLPAPLAALSERVRAQFDPEGVFNPGRMYPRAVNAN